MSEKKPNAMRRDVSPKLLEQFLNGEEVERLGEALRHPDIRVATADEARGAPDGGTAPSPGRDGEPQRPTPGHAIDTGHGYAGKVETASIQSPAPVAPQAPRMEASPSTTIEHAGPVTAAPSVPASERASEPRNEGGLSLEIPEAAEQDESRSLQLYGRRGERAIDINLSLTKEQGDRLNVLLAHEILRLGRKVSTSEIARHLIDFALHHVEENRVIPTPDGLGLRKLPKGR